MPAASIPNVSVIIPAKNESQTVGALIRRLKEKLPTSEVIVVNDGSTDDTAAQATLAGAVVVNHPVSRGNGAAVKSGARKACGEILVFMDADGQHDPDDIPALLAQLDCGFDLVVGSRDSGMHASGPRLLANILYNRLASWITGVPIADLTSGFRAARADLFRSFLYLLPNGFSYPTTSTMAFLRAGHAVTFVPIRAQSRAAGTSSHIRLFHDGSRFLIIIFRIGTLYSPLKIFLPFSLLFFLLGTVYYAYTFITAERFTNLGALLFSTSILVFLIGLVSEQITQLLFSQHRRN